VAASLSASPPVDTDRVATIRKAIEEGRFPLSPATIADNMIALKLNWVRNEPA
jgi:negative regulator of flagellin synthesis FlgM